MGDVYLSIDNLMKRRVALKVPHDDAVARQRFEEERRLHAPLLHPSIMPVLDQGWIKLNDKWFPYFTMPEYQNGPFTRRVNEVHEASKNARRWSSGGHWTLRRLVEAVQRVADALTYAHHEGPKKEKGVLHLDIAPKNILTGYTDAEVLLGDWGLSVEIRRDDAPAQLPDVTGPRGTPGFIAPEHLQDPTAWPNVGHDLYALGAVLYNVLCGEQPYHEHAGAHRNQAAKEFAPLPMESVTALPIPPALAELTRYAMQRDPLDRPPSAKFISRELKAWLDLGPSAIP